AFFPQLAQHGFTLDNRRLFARALLGLGALGLLGVGLVHLFAHPIARLLYGPLAGDVVPLLQALAPLLVLQFLEVPMASALHAVHREGTVLRILVVGTGASLALGIT